MMSERPITGTFNYVLPMDEPPVFHTEDLSKGNLKLEGHVMTVSDMRTAAPTWEKEGFMRVHLPLNVGEKRDPKIIEQIYNPSLMEVVHELTGAPKIILTPPLFRWSEKTAHPEIPNSIPARYVHCDYDRESFHAIMRSMIEGDPERDRWLAGRYAAFNTWRALTPPPQDLPLAVIDRSSLAPEDFVRGTVVIDDGKTSMSFPQNLVHYNAAHRWSYISNMTADDLLFFVGFDSANDALPGNPHSAFEHPASGAVPRSSCEVRAFVYWG